RDAARAAHGFHPVRAGADDQDRDLQRGGDPRGNGGIAAAQGARGLRESRQAAQGRFGVQKEDGMKDTRPLVVETDSDEIRTLLRSAELGEPPSGAMRRVLTRAGVGVGVGLAAVATSTSTASAAKVAPVVVGKWLAITAFVGAGAVAAVHVARPNTFK